jgi:hypothetical protein
MKIDVGLLHQIILKEVFYPIELITDKGEVFHICMRDNGFEFSYGGNKYSAQNGSIRKEGDLILKPFRIEVELPHEDVTLHTTFDHEPTAQEIYDYVSNQYEEYGSINFYPITDNELPTSEI